MADHKKEVIVEKLKEQLASAKGAVFTTYKGLTVAQDTELRRELRAAGVTYHVVKNTMVRRAADALGLEGLDPHLEGTTAFAFSAEHERTDLEYGECAPGRYPQCRLCA